MMRFSSRMAKFDFNMRRNQPSASILILMDVKQLGHFIQIRVFLSIFNDLYMANLKKKKKGITELTYLSSSKCIA